MEITDDLPGFSERATGATLHRLDAIREERNQDRRLWEKLAEQLDHIAHSLEPREQDTVDLDALSQQLAVKSKPLLTWQTTVGANHRIPLDAESRIIQILTNQEASTVIVLGPKGSGKSALSAVIGNAALAHGLSVLAIKADELPSWVVTPATLQEWLEFPLPVVDAVRLLAADRMVLVLIDQLDSVSELVDRKSDRLNLLLNLVHTLSGVPNVHIVASCREFDYRHDARLSTLSADEMHVELPTWDEVAPVLQESGYDPNAFGDATRELLRTPWHLSLFLKSKPSRIDFTSLQSLIDAVWERTVLNADGPPGRIDLLERIANRMSGEEELFVPAALADDSLAARDALLHDEVLVKDPDSRILRFRHQTYYDYTLARAFVRGTDALSDYVLQRQDGLFVRPTMLSALELLRATSRGIYHRQVNSILGGGPRPHIRSLLLEFLAQQHEPDDAEAGIILAALPTREGPLVLSASAGSRGWFERLGDSQELAEWLQRPPAEAALCVPFLAAALQFSPAEVHGILTRYWLADPTYDHLVLTVAQYLPVWDSEWVRMIERVAERSDADILWTAERIADTQPGFAARLVGAQLKRLLQDAEKATALEPEAVETEDLDALNSFSRSDHAFTALLQLEREGLGTLPDIAARAPRPILETMWPWFITILQRVTLRSAYHGTYHDDWVSSTSYGYRSLPVFEALRVAAEQWAQAEPSEFVEFAMSAAETEFLAAHRVLTQAYTVIAPQVPEAAVKYLTGDYRRLSVGTHSSSHDLSQRLIAAVSPHLKPELRLQLEEFLVSFDPYSDRISRGSAEDKRLFRKWSREHRLRVLRSMPQECLSESGLKLLREEENLLPDTQDSDTWGEGGVVGPRMTVEELSRAKDEHIMRLVGELAEWERSGGGIRWERGVGRGGGSEQQAQALGGLAQHQPQRVVSLLDRFDPGRDVGDTYVACAVTGLAKSDLPTQHLLEVLKRLNQRGFQSEAVRAQIADAIGHRARQGESIPDDVVRPLEAWLDQIEIPEWPEERSSTSRYEGPLIFGRGGGFFGLTHGRGTVARAIADVYASRRPVDASSALRVLRSRLGKEKHPRVYAEMLYSMVDCFSVDLEEPSAAYDAAINDCPALLDTEVAVYPLGHLTGWVRPPELYQGWLERLANSGEERSRQAYGELLFFLYARNKQDPWADERITAALVDGQAYTLRGLVYAARETWYLPHCRTRATDILCAAMNQDDPKFPQILEFTFIPPEQTRFPMDRDTSRLIDAVCDHPRVLDAAGAQLLECLAPEAGTHPAIVLQVSRAIVARIAEAGAGIIHAISTAGNSLTSISIALHRLPNYRQEGLQLFEELINLGVREASAALELIDRRPSRSVLPIRPRPPRRRRRA